MNKNKYIFVKQLENLAHHPNAVKMTKVVAWTEYSKVFKSSVKMFAVESNIECNL